MSDRTPIFRILLVVFGLLMPAYPAQGQDSAGEVRIDLDWFGAGGVCRAGEFVGVRLSLTDGFDRPRDVLLRVSLTDADGDHPVPQRVVTTNPGVKQPVWIYFRLPFRFQQSDVLTFNVFAAVESSSPGAGAPDGAGFVPGRLLGSARVRAPRQPLSAGEGMFGVFGGGGLGLLKYSVTLTDATFLASGHERTEIVRGLDPSNLPDRWFGLAQFDVLVWGTGNPAQLGVDQAQALREWIRRGGHLVVVVPRVGQVWTDRAVNPLYDVVPRVRVERREQVDLAPYRVLLTTERLLPLPARETVQVFEPLGEGEPGQAIRILNTPDGAALAVRRLEGAGAVTLVGLDVTGRWFSDRGLPDPELFWHRVLGRRGDLLTEAQPGASQPLGRQARTFVLANRATLTLDRDIADQIAKTGRAAAGLLIGLVVFLAYWLAAGPVGYFVLKRRGWTRHAWMGFLATAGLFTAIAWGGATAIRPHRVDASHLTILDHVYGQPYQRARSWVSILVPTYGQATVSTGEREEGTLSGTDRMHDAVMPWDAPGSGEGAFPDSRSYVIDAKSPDAVTVPTRATVKQFQLDWAGGPRWAMPFPVAAGEASDSAGLRLLPRRPEGPVFEGSLVHKLPVPLSNVVVMVILGQRDHARALAGSNLGPLLADVVIYRPTAPWPADTPLDLGSIRYGASELQDRQRAATYLRGLIESDAGQSDVGDGFASPDPARSHGRLLALTFFTQLQTPSIAGDNDRLFIGRRRATHGYDLGRWFTQPCIIIVGQTPDDAPSPLPLFIRLGGGESREVPSRGRTLVRWVYPLPGRPPGYPGSEDEAGGVEAPNGE
jgi:hypothetical protein